MASSNPDLYEYKIVNTGSSDVSVDTPTGPETLKPGDEWQPPGTTEFYKAIDSATSGGQPVGAKLEGVSFPQLQQLVKNTPGGDPEPDEYTPNITAGTDEEPPKAFSPIVASAMESHAGQQDDMQSEEEKKQLPENESSPRSDPQTEETQTAADPINLFTGEFTIEETDIDIPQSIVGLHFSRTYRSGTPVFTAFGWNWDHNHNVFLREFMDDITPMNVARWNGRLHEDIFRKVGDEYKPPRGIFEKLTRVSSGHFKIEGTGGITWLFDNEGVTADIMHRIPLKSITDRFGNEIQYEYEVGPDGWARVTKVKSLADKRFFRFLYGECNMLETVEDRYDDGSGSGILKRYVRYLHDPDVEHLVMVRFYDATNAQDGDAKEFIYEDVSINFNLRHNIRFVADGNRRIYLENIFETNPSHPNYNKVVEQRFGEYVYQFDYLNLQMVPPPDAYATPRPEVKDCPARQTMMMAPDKAISLYTFNYRGDLLDHRMSIIRAGELQTLISMHEYDVEGNVIKSRTHRGSDQWNMVVTTFPYAMESTYNSTLDNNDPRIRGLATKRELKDVLGSTTISTRTVWEATYEDTNLSRFQNILTEKDERGNETQYTYDSAQGYKFLTAITHPPVRLSDGTVGSPGTLQTAQTLFEYETTGQLKKTTSAEGFKELLEYDTNTAHSNSYRRLLKRTRYLTTAETNPKIVEEFDYDTIGFTNSLIDGEGNVTTLVNTIRGWLKQATLPAISGSSPVITYRYDSDGNIIEIEHPKGSFTEAGFSDNFILEKIKRDILGHVVKTDFGANTSKPYTIIRTNDYRGNSLRVTDPNGNYQSATYDERGLLIESRGKGTDGSESLFKQRYDRVNNISSQFFGLKSDVITSRTYDEYNRPKTIEEKGGSGPSTKAIKSIYYSWTDQIPGSSSDVFPWKSGATRKRPSNNSWIESENLVILEEVTAGADPTTGTLLSRIFYEFDARGRVVLKRVCDFPSGPSDFLDTKYFYDKDNRLTDVEGPRGTTQTYSYEYDGIGRLTKVIDPLNNEQLYTYDGVDRVLTYERRDNDEVNSTTVTRTWENQYDERGRLIKITEPDSIETEFAYDERNLLLSVTDPLGTVTEFEYGLLGEKKKQILDATGLNIINQWDYDAAYRMTKYTDSTSQATNYVYDGIGRLVTTEIPGGAIFSRTFGIDGRLLTETAASGAQLSFTYDTYGRLATLVGSSGSGGVAAVSTHTYTYDALDRVIEASLPSGPDVERVFDGLGRLIEETTHGITLKMSYDAASGTIVREWSNGRKEQLDLNVIGIIKKVNRSAAGTSPLGNDGSLALFDNLKSLAPGIIGTVDLFGNNGTNTLQLFQELDNRMRITYKAHKVGAIALIAAQYRYDAASRRKIERITPFVPSGQIQNRFHAFDKRNRLTSTIYSIVTPPAVLGTGQNISQSTQNTDIAAYQTSINSASSKTILGFEFDVSGANQGKADVRTKYTQTSLPDRSYTYTTGHRMTAAGSDSVDTYTDGPIEGIGSQDYTIDALGRTIEIDGTYTITFDALGRPAILDDGTTAHKLCYFGEELWQEMIGSTIDRQYSHHPLVDGCLAVHVSGNTYATLNDCRANRIALVDSSAAIVEKYRYSPFGEPEAFNVGGTSVALSSVIQEPWFGGMRYMVANTLYLGRHRVLSPKHGIWLGLDPKGYIDSPNLYAYAGQNPIDFIDPLGLETGRVTEKGPDVESSGLEILGFPQKEFLGFPLIRSRMNKRQAKASNKSKKQSVSNTSGPILNSSVIELPTTIDYSDISEPAASTAYHSPAIRALIAKEESEKSEKIHLSIAQSLQKSGNEHMLTENDKILLGIKPNFDAILTEAEQTWNLAESKHVHYMNTYRYFNTVFGVFPGMTFSYAKPPKVKGLQRKSWGNVPNPKTSVKTVRTNLKEQTEGADVLGGYDDIDLREVYHQRAADMVMNALSGMGGFSALSLKQQSRFLDDWVDRVNKYGYRFQIIRQRR